MAEVITFRPSPEASEVLARIKDEGGNISKHLNKLLTSEAGAELTTRITLYPEENISQYKDLKQAWRESTPIGMLSLSLYNKFVDTLKAQNMTFFYYNIDIDHTVGFIAANQVLANIQFRRYYTRDADTLVYTRTSAPLPSIRYDNKTRTIVVITRENITL